MSSLKTHEHCNSVCFGSLFFSGLEIHLHAEFCSERSPYACALRGYTLRGFFFFFFFKKTFLNPEGFFRQVKKSSFQKNNLPKR